MLLVWRQDGHEACKNFCFKTAVRMPGIWMIKNQGANWLTQIYIDMAAEQCICMYFMHYMTSRWFEDVYKCVFVVCRFRDSL